MSADFTSREFNQDVSRAKRAAREGPVFITDRGRRSHVLLSAEEYQRLVGRQPSILDLIGRSDAAGINLDFPRMGEGEAGWGWRVPDLDD